MLGVTGRVESVADRNRRVLLDSTQDGCHSGCSCYGRATGPSILITLLATRFGPFGGRLSQADARWSVELIVHLVVDTVPPLLLFPHSSHVGVTITFTEGLGDLAPRESGVASVVDQFA